MQKLMTALFTESKEVAWEHTAPGIKRKVMVYDENLMLVKVSFEKSAVGSLHSHPHTQVSYVESGSFEIEIGGEKKILKTGDVFYVPSNVTHGAVCVNEGVLVDVFYPMREDFVTTNGKI